MSNLILGLFRSIQVRPEPGQAATMSTIFTSCPNSGRDISTGIEIEPKCFVDVPDVITRCPHCGSGTIGRNKTFLRECSGA